MKKIYFLLIFLFIGITTTLNAQTWTQIGADIDGEAAGDNSGYSVSLSSDGSVIAIGAIYNSGNGTWSGHVRIYQNIDGVWTQIGSDINGEEADSGSGNSVSLNSDGSIVAIGARYNDGNGTSSGHVRIYQNIDGVWTQIGTDIDGENPSDVSGSSLSLSADGTIVAIGAQNNDGNGSQAGHVRIYENIAGIWTQIGVDIDGDAALDYFGYSISLSSDGSVVAISAPQNDGNGNESGQVKIYKNIVGAWTQIGDDIEGEMANDRLGSSVSLNSDGSIVAIGASTGNDRYGLVSIFQNISGVWTQIGVNINGEASNDYFGESVSLSSDGSTVAIGAKYNDGNGSDAGYARIFQNISATWMQVGADIDGEAADDYFGHSISLSSDGSVVAIGAPQNDGNLDNSGHVTVYKVEPPIITTQPIDQTGICLGDEVNFSVIAENTDLYQWQVSMDGGNSWNNIEDSEIYSGTKTNTLTVTTDNSINNSQYQCNVGIVYVTSNAVTLTFETENPTITCIDNQEKDADANLTYTVVGNEFDPSGTDDNCEVASVINDFNSMETLAGASLPLGTTNIVWTVTDVAGNQMGCSFSVIVANPTGINKLEELGISIYPNPTNGIVKLDFANNNVQKLKISDMAGRTIIENTAVQQNETIDLSKYSSGIYIISVETDNGSFTSKIIKE